MFLKDFNLLYKKKKKKEKKKKQAKLRFDILDLYFIEMLFETFYEEWTNALCTEAIKRILIHYGL